MENQSKPAKHPITGTFILIHNELDQLHAQLESDMATVEVVDSDDSTFLVSHDLPRNWESVK